MGLAEVFRPEDRVELTVNDLVSYFREEARTYAENEVIINGLRAGLPEDHILVMIGKLGTDCVISKELTTGCEEA